MTKITEPDKHPQYPHLSLACGETMGSKVARLDYIEDVHWVSYPGARDALDKMEKMLKKSRRKRKPDTLKKRKHHLIIEAESNNGKSAILQEFELRHPIQENPTGDGIIVPFLLIELPAKPNEVTVYNEMLKKLKATHQGRVMGGDKHLQVLWLLEQIKVQMMGVDELSNILRGTEAQRTEVLNVFKYLGNSLEIPVVSAGVPEVEECIRKDPQWKNRFHTKFLPRWKLNKEFADLLASLELDLPLPEPSNLGTTPEIVMKLFTMSDGLIGEVAQVLEDVTEFCIENNKPCITRDLLDSHHEWEAPSQRRRIRK